MSIGLPRNTLYAVAPLNDELTALFSAPPVLPRALLLSRCLSRSRHAEALTGIFDVCIRTFRGDERLIPVVLARRTGKAPPPDGESFRSFTPRRRRRKTTALCRVYKTKVIVMRSRPMVSASGMSKVVERFLVTVRNFIHV